MYFATQTSASLALSWSSRAWLGLSSAPQLVHLGQAWGRKVGRAESSEPCPDEGTNSKAILRVVRSKGYAHARLTDGGVLTDDGSAPGKESCSEREE